MSFAPGPVVGTNPKEALEPWCTDERKRLRRCSAAHADPWHGSGEHELLPVPVPKFLHGYADCGTVIRLRECTGVDEVDRIHFDTIPSVEAPRDIQTTGRTHL